MNDREEDESPAPGSGRATAGAILKVLIEAGNLDRLVKEARRFLGLPDVAPMQDAT